MPGSAARWREQRRGAGAGASSALRQAPVRAWDGSPAHQSLDATSGPSHPKPFMTLSGVFCPEVAGPVHIPRRGLWLRSLAGETRVAPEACSHAGGPSPRRQPPGTALSVTGSREGVTAPPAERRMPRSPGPGDRPTPPSPAGGAGERAPPVGTVALLKGPSHGCWEPVASAPGPTQGWQKSGPLHPPGPRERCARCPRCCQSDVSPPLPRGGT